MIMLDPVSIFAETIASRKLQSESQIPSFVSATFDTVKVVQNADADNTKMDTNAKQSA